MLAMLASSSWLIPFSALAGGFEGNRDALGRGKSLRVAQPRVQRGVDPRLRLNARPALSLSPAWSEPWHVQALFAREPDLAHRKGEEA